MLFIESFDYIGERVIGSSDTMTDKRRNIIYLVFGEIGQLGAVFRLYTIELEMRWLFLGFVIG